MNRTNEKPSLNSGYFDKYNFQLMFLYRWPSIYMTGVSRLGNKIRYTLVWLISDAKAPGQRREGNTGLGVGFLPRDTELEVRFILT